MFYYCRPDDHSSPPGKIPNRIPGAAVFVKDGNQLFTFLSTNASSAAGKELAVSFDSRNTIILRMSVLCPVM
jgi:hypothetical protein